jgi:MOB kinase activator 1
LEIVTELGEECTPKLCPKMTTGPDWEYKCMNHGNPKFNPNCSAIDYYIHTLDTTMHLLTNPIFYPDRDNISGHSAKAFSVMVRYLYRMFGHIYYHHRKLFHSLEYKYRIAERLTLYCKKYNIIAIPKEYCINI